MLEGVVEHKLGCRSTEVARDISKGREQGAGDVHKDKGKDTLSCVHCKGCGVQRSATISIRLLQKAGSV